METDEILFELIQAGDTAAFDKLYGRYQGPLFSFVLGYLKNRQEAEEIFHEALMIVLREQEISFEAGGFRAWIYTVSRNLSLNRLRAERRFGHGKVLWLEETKQQASKASLDEEAPTSTAEVARNLPPPLAEIYQLRISGLTNPQIALNLNIPVGTVKSRMHQMMKILKRKVKNGM